MDTVHLPGPALRSGYKPIDAYRRLREFLKCLPLKAKNCPNCGGIIPELSFTYEDTTYFFTCYQILKNGVVTAKTDYTKFAKYCKVLKEKKE